MSDKDEWDQDYSRNHEDIHPDEAVDDWQPIDDDITVGVYMDEDSKYEIYPPSSEEVNPASGRSDEVRGPAPQGPVHDPEFPEPTPAGGSSDADPAPPPGRVGGTSAGDPTGYDP